MTKQSKIARKLERTLAGCVKNSNGKANVRTLCRTKNIRPFNFEIRINITYLYVQSLLVDPYIFNFIRC